MLAWCRGGVGAGPAGARWRGEYAGGAARFWGGRSLKGRILGGRSLGGCWRGGARPGRGCELVGGEEVGEELEQDEYLCGDGV